MRTRSIIFDIDGTAVDSPVQKLPTKQLVEAIASLRERYFLSAATGRVWTFAQPILRALDLTDPCIISAGTQICNPVTGEILWQKNIESSSLDQVIAVFQQYPEWKLLYNDGTEDDYFNGGVYPQDFTHTDPVYFLEQVFVPDQVALEVSRALERVPGITCVMVTAQKPGCRDLHIVNSAATKEHAVTELLRQLGVEKGNAIGIGDGHNDLHLFHAVGYKVAMGNAVPELKLASDKVIESVSEDGLVVYLKSLQEDPTP